MHHTLSKSHSHSLKRLLALALFASICLPTLASSDNLDGLQAGQRAFNAGNFILSFALWTTLATQGHADAQVFVGLSYQNGWGTPKSAKLAEIWYQKAARNNNASGQFLLGLQYIRGSHADRSKGLMWLQRAAANGELSAQEFIEKGQKRGWFTGISAANT